MYLKGTSLSGIGRHFGCSSNTVKTWHKNRRWRARKLELEDQIEGHTEEIAIDAATARDQAGLAQIHLYKELLGRARLAVASMITVEEMDKAVKIVDQVVTLGERIHGKRALAPEPINPTLSQGGRPRDMPRKQGESFDPDTFKASGLTPKSPSVQSSTAPVATTQNQIHGGAGGARPQAGATPSQANPQSPVIAQSPANPGNPMLMGWVPGHAKPERIDPHLPTSPAPGTQPGIGEQPFEDTELSPQELAARRLPPGHPSRARLLQQKP